MVGEKLKIVHTDDYLEFIDDLRNVYFNTMVAGSEIDDMVTFLAYCTELARRAYTFHVLRLRCLCLSHVCPVLPSVRLGSPMCVIEAVDLSSFIEP